MPLIPIAASEQARFHPWAEDSDPLNPLWRLSGDLHNARVLLLATGDLDLMCALIRHGCLAATELRPGEKLDTGEYDLVLMPRVAMAPSFGEVIRLGRRALGAGGRMVLGMGEAKAAVSLARSLRLNGFVVRDAIHRPDRVWLGADLRRPS